MNLYIEYLAVLDSTVYLKYKNLYNQLNDQTLMQFLNIYYSQLVNAVKFLMLKKIISIKFHIFKNRLIYDIQTVFQMILIS